MNLRKDKVLLVDNEDSFTFNLVQIFEDLNIDLQLVNGKTEYKEEYLDYKGILLSPGPGIPDDFPLMKSILGHAMQKPILGICLGMQAIAEYYGAKLLQLKEVQHGQVHNVDVIRKGKLFEGIPDQFVVGLYHSWAVDSTTIPHELEITCLSKDLIPMGIRHRYCPIEGLQFHPESFLTLHGRRMIYNWLKLILT